MRLLPRRTGTGTGTAAVADPAVEAGSARELPATGPKGRPTPKRRESVNKRGPAAPPPRTRKEAYRWQKDQAAKAKVSATAPKLSKDAYREALRRGDPSVLPRRDQGPVKALARNWVDSHRMFSNFLLVAFALILLGSVIPRLNILTVVVLVVTVGEWAITGRRIKALAVSRGIPVKESTFGIGFYAGSRAYLPRRWRLPAAQVARGDAI